MNRGMLRAAAGAAAALLAVAVCFRLAGVGRGPAAPRPATVELSPGVPAVAARIDAKRRIAQDVIDGRRPLLEAAASFRALDEVAPPRPGWTPPEPPPGVSPDEVYCRQVIGWVRTQAPGDRSDERVRALEAELSARLRDGALHLPDLPPRADDLAIEVQ